MMRSMASKVVTAATILALVATFVGLVGGDPHISLPGRVEEAWRAGVLALCGVAAFFLMTTAWMLAGIKLDQSDKLSRPTAAYGISYSLLLFYIAADMVRILDAPYITFRTPVSTLGLLIGVGAMYCYQRTVKRLVKAARLTNATVKMTMTDTSKPGPDVDLDHVATQTEQTEDHDVK